MSLGICIKGSEGLVLAAESRLTLTTAPNGEEGRAIHVNFDNALKVLSFSPPNTAVGAVTYGAAAIGWRTAASFIPEFEASLPAERLPVGEFAIKLGTFFMQQWRGVVSPGYKGPDMTFLVGGFDEGPPYGRVFQLGIPSSPDPQEMNPGDGQFGISWGGQREFVDRLIQGYDSNLLGLAKSALGLTNEQVEGLARELTQIQMTVPLDALGLQDCVDLALFFVQTTISGQRLTVGIRGCGGPIDVATITRREGLQWVQRKQITGQAGQNGGIHGT